MVLGVDEATLQAAIAGDAFRGLAFVIIAIAFLVGVVWFIGFVQEVANPKSKKYRTLLKDMYVVGTIKKLADKEGINLIEEMKVFSRVVKNSNMRGRDLDNVIENELNEKISEEFERQKEQLQKEAEKEKKKEEKK